MKVFLQLLDLTLALFVIFCTNIMYAYQISLLPDESNIERYIGDPLVVLCKPTNGVPARWVSYRGDVVSDDSAQRVHVERKQNGIALRFKNLSKADKGNWTCETAAPYYRKSFTLHVKERIKIKANPVEYAPLGEPFQIFCSVDPQSDAEVKWKKGHQKQALDDAYYESLNGVLRIKRVSLVDNDTFWCTVDIYQTGTFIDYPIKVIVCKSVTQPYIVCQSDPCAVESERAVLLCHSSGIPPPKFQWSKGPRFISPVFANALHIQSSSDFKYHTDGNTLIINKLNVSDNGTYECRAFNEFDREGKSASFNLTVLIPPKISSIQPITANLMSSAEFVCDASQSDNKDLSFKWLYGNGSVIIPTVARYMNTVTDYRNLRSYLRFDRLTKEHFGYYICEVTNVAGTSRAKGMLLVNFKPHPTPNVPTTFYGIEGHEVTLRCCFDAYPPTSLVWYDSTLSNYPLEEGHRGVQRIRERQIGLYTFESTLTYIPTSLSNDVVFTCEAINARDSVVRIRLKKASLPDKAEFYNQPKIFSDSISFDAKLPDNTGGLPVTFVEVRYRPVSSEREPLTHPYYTANFNASAANQNNKRIPITLSGLLPSTLYRLALIVHTYAGSSGNSENLFKTTGKSGPMFEIMVTDSNQTSNATEISCRHFSSCALKWRVLSDGGSPIIGITISYFRMRSGEDDYENVASEKSVNVLPSSREYVLRHLVPFSTYLVRVKLSNKISSSTQSVKVRTTNAPPGYRELQEMRKRPSVWAVVGIILMILIVLILLCFLVICLRMPKPTNTNHFDRKTGFTPDSSMFNHDLRDARNPLNSDVKNSNPLYRESSILDSPWNTLLTSPDNSAFK